MVVAAIKIGPIEISTFWLMLTVGIAGMFLCANSRRGVFGLSCVQSGVFSLLLTVCGVAGTVLLYFLETGSFGGVSFYGSVFLIPLLMPLVGRMFRLSPGQTLDICGPCVAIMIGCMRFSCFLTGCCGGWQVCLGSLCFEWPTQMLDSICDFIICGWLLRKEEQTSQSGVLYPMFMASYSAMRFFIEFLRDTQKDWLYMSHGQWFALTAILIGAVWIYMDSKRVKKSAA